MVRRDVKVTWSSLKPAEKFRAVWDTHGFEGSDITEEHVFCDHRKWRLDFAWPSLLVGVEVHGFGFGHQSVVGLAKDCEKVRDAIHHGWVVIPFSSACLGSREKVEDAVEFVCGVLEQRAQE